ncbi:recombinase family protein [Streptomyces cacaoi]|uniref:Recombinase domain-containing protein n=1 Tax=Streptomyces cacaoi TaxID=1898 RepID=A0A4Y3RB79_STRCI|nr:recombinase family protein [Streptomyces cacaoi]NNG87591.1 recombinase family protein [Streptomyces cacaoi]GEB54108.1 hypothetical protein SCA03_66590 [Streptomyces cacaoi]
MPQHNPLFDGRSDGKPLRVLAALRISLDDDASTSIERQWEEYRQWAKQYPGVTLVKATEDRSVSGSIDLKDRPQLGPWLTHDKRDEWDAIWVSTQDRLGRDDLHFMAFLKDVLDWQKLIYVGDDSAFDISTETGRLIAYAKATQAAGELRKIRERAQKSRDYLRRHGLWPGGNLPFGYKPVQIIVGEKIHYKLGQEKTYSKLLRKIREQIVRDKTPIRQIAAQLTSDEILTWKDYEATLPPLPGARKKKREPKGAAWHPSAIAALFKNVACIGWVTYTDKTTGKVRIAELDNGDPVMFTDEPILTEAEREEVLAVIEERGSKPLRARSEVSRESGVGRCGECGEGLTINRVTHRLKSGLKRYERYRCASSTKAIACPEPAYIEKDLLGGFVDSSILTQLGDKQEVRIKKQKGDDPRPELEKYRTRLDRVEKEDEEGLYDDDRESYFKKRKSLLAKIKELEAKPVIPDTVEYEFTGRTFGQKWQGMTSSEQREYLIAHNVVIGAWRSGQIESQRAAFIWFGDLVKAANAMGVEATPSDTPLWGFDRLNLTPEQEQKARELVAETLPEGEKAPF